MLLHLHGVIYMYLIHMYLTYRYTAGIVGYVLAAGVATSIFAPSFGKLYKKEQVLEGKCLSVPTLALQQLTAADVSVVLPVGQRIIFPFLLQATTGSCRHACGRTQSRLLSLAALRRRARWSRVASQSLCAIERACCAPSCSTALSR